MICMERTILPQPDPASRPVPETRRATIDRIARLTDDLVHRVATAHAREFVEIRATMSQAKVLHLVNADPGVRMSELAGRLGVSLSTLSGVVDRMVEQGYLRRSDDPADRRHVVLRLTELGDDQLLELRTLSERHFAPILAEIDDAGLAVVEQAFGILAAAAAAASARAAASPTPSKEGSRP